MNTEIWTESDKLEAEDKVQQAVDYLRYTERGKTSVYKRNLNRNIIIREVNYPNLKEGACEE